MTSMYCRLCLKIDYWDSPMPIFNSTSSLSTMVTDLLGIEVKQNDSLPQVICHLCLAKITFLDEFHKQVKESVNLMNSLAQLQGEDNTEAKAESNNISRQIVAVSQNTQQNINGKSGSDDVAVEPTISKNCDEINKKNSRASNPPAERKENFSCPKCKYRTTSKKSFDIHVALSFSCRICDMTFCTNRGAKIHEKCHKRHQRLSTSNANSTLVSEPSDKIIDSSENLDNNSTSKNVSESSLIEKDNDNCTVVIDGNMSTYQWCKICDKVFLSGDDFYSHNQDVHNSSKTSNNKEDRNSSTEENISTKSKPKTKRPGPWSRTKGSAVNTTNDNSSDDSVVKMNKTQDKELSDSSESELDRPSSHNLSEKNIEITPQKEDFDSTDNDLAVAASSVKNKNEDQTIRDSDDNNGEEQPLPKRLKKSAGFSCWKCKGDFSSRQLLFIHRCINSVDAESSSKNQNVNSPLCVSSSEDEVIEPQSRKNRSQRIISDDYEEKDSDIDVQLIESEVDSPVENSNNLADIEFNNDGEDETNKSSYSTSVSKSTERKCNECGETFSRMKALVHHKRIHKTPLSNFYRFSLQKD